nr:MAG TPA: hypothetical protein [Bacteriophage sp.]
MNPSYISFQSYRIFKFINIRTYKIFHFFCRHIINSKVNSFS